MTTPVLFIINSVKYENLGSERTYCYSAASSFHKDLPGIDQTSLPTDLHQRRAGPLLHKGSFHNELFRFPNPKTQDSEADWMTF